MQLAHYLRLVGRWWWFLLLAAAIGGGTAYSISRIMTPIYRAEATLLVNQTQTPGVIAYNDVLTNERLTLTYRELITNRPVLDEVVDSLDLAMGPDDLGSLIDVAVVPNTQLLRLAVEHPDPEQARWLANATAQAFIASNAEDGLTRPGSVSIVEPAATPVSPVRPRTTLNTLIGAFAALLIAAAVAAVYEYLDDTVKTAEDVEAATGLPTLGGVARFPKGSGTPRGLVVGSAERSAAAEAYRVLRANLQFSTMDAKALVVTSASPREGKTTTVANLAVAMAQTGMRVIVVDSDLRRPTLHQIFGLTNGAGLTNALLSREPHLSQFLQPTWIDNLAVLTSGPIPPNPSELLSSRRMDGVIEALRNEADLVLFDSPPTLAVADAPVLAAKLDGAIIVVDTGSTRAQVLHRAADALARSKTRILGAVLNKLSSRGHDYYYAYNYYSSNGTNGHKRSRLPLGRRTRAPAPAQALSETTRVTR